eukprot:CAMPEP_0184484928 /NCGR_PEP_ID=MMETSP0113_2-20130426/6590_1 /TAXON_ID=91329 /ORGANISM="Norrisiella sphaerica, Strain BC52" /LENGTH=869 /DNA_ID=CAMNT_0026866151 /DNA_START=614 /DNA_END=3223 /DNA_ORIENTATION=-
MPRGLLTQFNPKSSFKYRGRKKLYNDEVCVYAKNVERPRSDVEAPDGVTTQFSQDSSKFGEIRSPLEPLLLSNDLSFEEKMSKLDQHFSARPLLVAARFAKILGTFMRVAAVWKLDRQGPDEKNNVKRPPICEFEPSADECQQPEAEKYRGKVLRDAITSIGVLFIKLAQTAATRPDLIGEEAAQALEKLQDRTTPFNDAIAKQIINEEVGLDIFAEITDSPVAAASLAQVYRARLKDGSKVAVKVRRPGLVDQVALDSYITRLILRQYTKYFAGAERDYQLLFNEVGSGLLEELDFRREADNANEFAQAHRHIPFLRVPSSIPEYITQRVLTLEWIDGQKLTELRPVNQRKMVKMGIDICFAQLLSTGIVHADPHYGNMLYDQDGKLTLLDFGLVTRVTPVQKEAMAGSIVHTLDEDWEGLIEDYRTLGLLPSQPAIWADKDGNPQDGLGPGWWKPVTEEEFLTAFKKSLDADISTEGGEKRKRTFSEITSKLTELSFQYRFTLPEWMLFIIRSVVTLDGFAGRMNPPFNALELAYPHALRRALTPTTKKGQESLMSLILTKDGDLNIQKLQTLFQDMAERQDSSSSAEKHDKATESSSDNSNHHGSDNNHHSSDNNGWNMKKSSSGGLGDFTKKAESNAQPAETLTTTPRLSNNEIIIGLLSSADGAALRRIIYQLNTQRLLSRVLRILVSPYRRMRANGKEVPRLSSMDERISELAEVFLKEKVLRRLINPRVGCESVAKTEAVSIGGATGGHAVVSATAAYTGANTDPPVAASNGISIAPAASDVNVSPEERTRRWRRVRKILTRAHAKRCISSPKTLLTAFAIIGVVGATITRMTIRLALSALLSRLSRSDRNIKPQFTELVHN